MNPACFLFACSLALGAHAANESSADFAQAARIEVGGASSHFRVMLPAPAYRASARRDLGDLRIANAQGEFVPHAFAPRGIQGVVPVESRDLKLFPLYGDDARGVEGLSLRVERNRAGTVVRVDAGGSPPAGGRKLVGYLVELPVLPRPLRALSLDWRVKEGFTGAIRVEASDDLRRWEVLAARAPIVQLEHAGERLERKRVELAGAREAKYLRFSFSGVPADFTLLSAGGELAGERPDPSRESMVLLGLRDTEKPTEYTFDAGGAFPVERVRVELPQANTVAPVQIFSRERAEGEWRLLATAAVYRLSREGGDVTNPDIAFGPVADRFWRLRVDPRSGGLGSGDVKFVIAWQPHELVFAARGGAPFVLLAGSKSATAAALPLATLLPGYREGETIKADAARLGEFGANAAARKPEAAGGSLREFAATAEGRTQILWAVLVAGVLLLVWMATRLMGELGKKDGGPGG